MSHAPLSERYRILFYDKIVLKIFQQFTSDRSKSVEVEAEAPPFGLKFTKAISFVLKNWVMTSFMTTWGETYKEIFYVIRLTLRLVFEQSALEKPFTSEIAELFFQSFCVQFDKGGVCLLSYLHIYLHTYLLFYSIE